MTTLERAARALHATGDFDPHQFGEDEVWPELVDYVRTVLQAIRDPSDAMIAAAENAPAVVGHGDDEVLWPIVWRDMIDAALEEL